MTNFSIQPGQTVKPSQTWGLGSFIGERQVTIVTDNDYEDLAAVQDAVLAAFSDDADDRTTPQHTTQ